MERHVATHQMRAEDGSVYEVDEFQDLIEAGSLNCPSAKIPGMKRLALANGGAVNFVDEDTFKIVATGQTVRRV